jgi:putative transposase
MSKPIHPTALFRLMVLGPLASRTDIERGDIKAIATELASKPYNIPDSKRTFVSKESILRWYYEWKRGGIEALQPLSRNDKGKTQLPPNVQEAIIQLKQDNPARSMATIINMIERQGIVSKGKVSRSSVHRFLQHLRLSKRLPSSVNTIERRAFVAAHAGDLWQGDVLHGPLVQTAQGMRKTYLVSLMDDATRLIVHSAFCLGETALDIEGVLKQAILKRGLPNKLLIDNGPAYRAQSLQTICAFLDIRLIYCKPYEPEAKGKLERFHRTFRAQFLNELDVQKIKDLSDLNARLWAWCESVYHTRPHTGLNGESPIERWRKELVHVRHLSPGTIERLDDLFLHRVKRRVKKDATVSWEGRLYEVHHSQVAEDITLLVDPHTQTVVRAETVFGDCLSITPLDRQANTRRKRQRPHEAFSVHQQTQSAVETAYEDYLQNILGFTATKKD